MNNKGLLLVFLTAVISGFSVFINKFGVTINNSNFFALAKNTLVAILLTALVVLLKKHRILFTLSKKQWGQLVLLGLIGGSIPFLLFFKGLALTGAAQGAFIHKTMFIFVAVLAAFILKEKINKNFVLGGLLLMLGNLIALKSLHFSFGRGDVLVLLAVLFWSAENILAKHILRDLGGNIVAWGRMFFGAAFIFIYLAATNQFIQPALALNPTQFSWILITAILLFAYVTTWYNGLKYIPVSLATTILFLGSPITTLLGAIGGSHIALKDTWSGILIIGGLAIIFGYEKLKERFKNYVRT